jgi:CheY-like chemotaxis protein
VRLVGGIDRAGAGSVVPGLSRRPAPASIEGRAEARVNQQASSQLLDASPRVRRSWPAVAAPFWSAQPWRLVAMARDAGSGTGPGETPALRVLLVEDEVAIAEMYRRGLANAGIAVKVAATAGEAVSVLRDSVFDLVLLDIQLPRVSGLEILADGAFRQALGAARVAVLSNYSEPATIQEAMSLGAAAYFVKSRYSPAELARRIRELISPQ